MKRLFTLLTILAVVLLATPSFAVIHNIEELDGSPSLYPWKVLFPNTSITDNGDGTATITFTGVVGSGVALTVTGFGGNLSSADDTVQKALDTIDDYSPSTHYEPVVTGAEGSVEIVFSGTDILMTEVSNG